MEKLKSSDVFKPGTFPEYTYISRMSSELMFTYEFRLNQALNTPGYLTSIIGPSKTGKTVLCEKVIGMDNIVSLTGSDFKNSKDFWDVVARKVGLSIKGEYSKTNTTQELINDNCKIESVASRDIYKSNKDIIIDYFKSNKYVLVLDDFHYASEELQFDIAYQLKDAIRKELKAIIISLPHRADDAIRKNADLSGRLNLINIEPWKKEELEEIAKTGFDKLGIKLPNNFIEKIAVESLTSPHLMQSICLNLSWISKIDEDDVCKLDMGLLEKSYTYTTLNLPYKDVVNKIKSGPSTRGNKRKTYKINDEEYLDVYGIILKAIAVNPPIISISIDELKSRVDNLMMDIDTKLDKNKLKKTLQAIQDIMTNSESIYQVFEWKDEQIYILEPLFLFYIRWGVK
ncbi:MAG: ATP-binding protein [Clostridiaceae bacterium]